MDEVFEKVKKIIAEKLDIEEDKITMEASFRRIWALTALTPMSSSMLSKRRWESRFQTRKPTNLRQ